MNTSSQAITYFTTKTFEKALQMATLSGGQLRKKADRTRIVLGSLREQKPFESVPVTNNGERRIDNCVKYDLGDGWRLVTRQADKTCTFLFIGDHEDTERWISAMAAFKSILADLELLRMPIAKYEIAKDRRMKEPLTMRAILPNNDATDDHTYNKNDPTRSHIMPTGTSGRGSMTWLVLDHSIPREYWVERQDLADRLLALASEIVPAGILEAQHTADATGEGKI